MRNYQPSTRRPVSSYFQQGRSHRENEGLRSIRGQHHCRQGQSSFLSPDSSALDDSLALAGPLHENSLNRTQNLDSAIKQRMKKYLQKYEKYEANSSFRLQATDKTTASKAEPVFARAKEQSPLKKQRKETEMVESSPVQQRFQLRAEEHRRRPSLHEGRGATDRAAFLTGLQKVQSKIRAVLDKF